MKLLNTVTQIWQPLVGEGDKKKLHFYPPQMVIWVTVSGKTHSTGLYLSKTPMDLTIEDFRTPTCKTLRLQKVNNLFLSHLMCYNNNTIQINFVSMPRIERIDFEIHQSIITGHYQQLTGK